MPSLKDIISKHASRRARFQKQKYDAVEITIEDVSPASSSPPPEDQHQRNKKVLFQRCNSIGVDYRILASINILYEDKLVNATAEEDIDSCQELIKSGMDINQKDVKYGLCALHVAARRNYLQMLQFLIKEGADINLKSKAGPTPLHIAIRQRSEECCRYLLACPNINIHAIDSDAHKCLPLHLACKIGNYDLCKRLVDLDCEKRTINGIDKNKRTPLHEAAARGFLDIVKLLLVNKAKWYLKDRKSLVPIHLAAQNGHVECCIELLSVEKDEQPRKMTKDRSTALMLASRQGHFKICELLRTHGCDVDAQNSSGETALHFAAKSGYFMTVDKLLDWGAKVLSNNKGNTPVHVAASLKNTECLDVLLKKSDVRNICSNNDEQNVLHIATRAGAEECLNRLLEEEFFKTKIDQVDSQKRTPLQCAVRKGNSECAQILLENGADPLTKDSDSNLPLHIAASKNLIHICKLLTRDDRQRSSVNSPNKDNATPLHLAALKDAKECCERLVYKGAAKDTRDKYGNTPVHLAAKAGNLRTLNFFIKSGANLTQLIESSGDTALHLASCTGKLECCQLILKKCKKSVEILNVSEKYPLDLAFENEHDMIYQSILQTRSKPKVSEINNPKYTKRFQMALHAHMHEALLNRRKNIVESLVSSNFWFACFNAELCDEDVCENFNIIIELYPDLAKIVFDKCVDRDKGYYHFDHFDAQFYINEGDQKKRKCPFDKNDHGLLETAKERKDRDWLTEHPLRKAIDSEDLNLLLHPLTSAYLRYKWISYIRNIFLILLIFECLSLLNLSINIGFSWNFTHMSSLTNKTEDDLCQMAESNPLIGDGKLTRTITSLVQMVFLIYHIILEIQLLIRMKRSYFSLTPAITAAKILRCLGILIYVIPFYICSFDLGLKMTWQWQVGVVTLLLCWFLFIHMLNQLPILSVFMPVTRKFALSYAKVLFYIILILFMFAYSFHLLLNNQPSFANIPIAFIKSVVWMLGDLGYDDSFVEIKIEYPLMTNILFLIFVTSISFFIINMVITNPSEHLDIFRKRATVHKAISRSMFFLKLEAVFAGMRKKYVRKIWVDNQANNKEANLILGVFDQIDDYNDEESMQAKISDDAQLRKILMECLEKKNEELLNVIKENIKVRNLTD